MYTEPVITVSHLSKSYEKPVLNDINFTITPGQIIGYLGPNGAGKSTTIKVLSGMITDFTGEVQIMGMDVRKDPIEVKRRIGYIPENALLYDTLTPIEYLRFIGLLHKMESARIEKKSLDLLRIFDLQAKADTRMTAFSKGMRQKVLLIAGLLHNPDIIFLDEPLSGLDANAVILVKEILSKLALEGKTLFYSSHIMDVVEKFAHRIMILHQGKIIADGTFAELQEREKTESLEQIFTELTGNHAHQSQAGEFIEALRG
ncbi:ABC transporter ATP-binding protein [Xanthocytophaga agilis]|uniref:ABC transporter ATP-binding protein n=1 Tax=Xanthocytophaga agilis TaxID=3048010 RepID=A0AAE3RBT2_9BACT|nr:ABC transporter ATP-binding protein [Xanthocytophaga agilis]MDJ1505390.1 ABC transporter ATP-binding protein [Xanthocytophaga agilis]